MDGTYTSLEDLAQRIVSDAAAKTILIFASNSVGKTTLSRRINSIKPESCLCFNTFVEEAFLWENNFEDDEFNLIINQHNSLINKAIIEQGLEGRIGNIFKSLINAKIDPKFEIKDGAVSKITFSLATGDEKGLDGIKLSRGEESVFIWSIFCALAEMVLDEKSNDNSDYDHIDYIIIDDPVNSLSEECIVPVALGIIELILNKASEVRQKGKTFGILITAHNRLLYNVLFSEQKNHDNSFRLYRNDDGFILVHQKNGSPFGYHLEEIKSIKEIIDANNKIEKVHFNMFRNVLEKTASFLGYNKWDECLNNNLNKKDEIIKLINLHSHSRLIDLDDKKIENPQEAELFRDYFNKFLEDYKWRT